jgi:hypothetical protein
LREGNLGAFGQMKKKAKVSLTPFSELVSLKSKKALITVLEQALAKLLQTGSLKQVRIWNSSISTRKA